jgi:HSP20 family protein
MPSDPFADFARMRREMDQLLGDAWERAGYGQRRETGFSPRVDVYYCGDPRRAVVKVDLAGIDLAAVSLEISGRELVISGERPLSETEGKAYQQMEIPTGSFRRRVELGVDVAAEQARATYEDGILTVELPLRETVTGSRRVPIERVDG